MAVTKNSFTKKDLVTIFVILILGIVLVLFKPKTSQHKLDKQTLPTASLSVEARGVGDECKDLNNKEQCYAKAFANLTKKTDMQHAFSVLRELQRTDPDARGCHFIAHSISTAETQKDPSKWKEIMNSAPQDCSYGAAHGALEVHSANLPDGKLSENEIETLCNNPDTNNCTHILGHLLLVMNDNDINKSIPYCQKLPHDDRGKFECLTGIFMERITAFNLEQHGLATKEALNWAERVPELEKLCRSETGTNSVACWKEIVHAALIKYNNDPQKIVNFCETAPGKTETDECINHSLGIMAGAYNFELSRMHSICEVKVENPNFQNHCYAALVGATISTVPNQIKDAVTFCSTINHQYQSDCFLMIGNSLHNASQELHSKLETECSSSPLEYKDECIHGGNMSIETRLSN